MHNIKEEKFVDDETKKRILLNYTLKFIKRIVAFYDWSSQNMIKEYTHTYIYIDTMAWTHNLKVATDAFH